MVTTDSKDFRITQLLSRSDNCMIYNSINYNRDPKDDVDVLLLKNLRAMPGADKKVLEYYSRSEPIVKQIKSVHGESTAVWDIYYQTYVRKILISLKKGNVEQAQTQIFAMLTDLESKQKN